MDGLAKYMFENVKVCRIAERAAKRITTFTANHSKPRYQFMTLAKASPHNNTTELGRQVNSKESFIN